MNTIQKSKAIKASLRKGYQDGGSKMAHRKCYGYEVGLDGELTLNPEEAKVVRWIFEQYLAGGSLGKIIAGLEKQGISTLMLMRLLFLARYSWLYLRKNLLGQKS